MNSSPGREEPPDEGFPAYLQGLPPGRKVSIHREMSTQVGWRVTAPAGRWGGVEALRSSASVSVLSAAWVPTYNRSLQHS